jgi:hypothetical protein
MIPNKGSLNSDKLKMKKLIPISKLVVGISFIAVVYQNCGQQYNLSPSSKAGGESLLSPQIIDAVDASDLLSDEQITEHNRESTAHINQPLGVTILDPMDDHPANEGPNPPTSDTPRCSPHREIAIKVPKCDKHKRDFGINQDTKIDVNTGIIAQLDGQGRRIPGREFCLTPNEMVALKKFLQESELCTGNRESLDDNAHHTDHETNAVKQKSEHSSGERIVACNPDSSQNISISSGNQVLTLNSDSNSCQDLADLCEGKSANFRAFLSGILRTLDKRSKCEHTKPKDDCT